MEEFVPRKGRKNLRGIPESGWGELKSASLGVKLTPTGKELVNMRFENVSEVLEKLGRGFFRISIATPSRLALAIVSELSAQQISVAEFAARSHIPLERVRSLLDSQKATEGELVWLQAALNGGKYDIEELMEWNNAEDIIGSNGDNRAVPSNESLSGIE